MRDDDSETIGDEDNDDNRVSATEALKEACETLIAQCDLVMDVVEEVLPEVRKDRLVMEDLLQNENDEFGEEEEEEEDGLGEEEDGYGDDDDDGLGEEVY